MRTRWVGCVGLLLWVGPLAAAEPAGKLVQEIWEAAYLEGAKAGFVHTTIHEISRDDKKLLRTTTELSLTVKRFRDTITMRMITGSEETPEGKVAGVFMRQFLAKDQELSLAGTVEGDQLHVVVDKGRIDKKVRWNDEVIGLYRQERLFQERKVKPGDRFSYLSYEPTVNNVVTMRVSVKEEEEVEILAPVKNGARKDAPGLIKKKLFRVEAVPDKIEVPGASVQLPAMVVWLDKELLPVRSQVEMPGLGTMVFCRTTREAATGQSGAPAQITDIGITQLIRLNRAIPQAPRTTSAVYRITLKGDDDPATAFAQDERQQVKNVKGNTFELHVRAAHGPQPKPDAGEAKEEYLKSCYFINSDDANVQGLARQAVGRETDPWKKAKLIERWVNKNMRDKNFTEAFATADQVARSLQGDCTEHAMLAAAMCRAVSVPSRTALGLVYVQNGGRPMMGFHMWAEVWVQGQWLPIDATLGQGYVGAAHIKIADHSWQDVQSLTPLLPVVRVLGKVAIEVVSINDEE